MQREVIVIKREYRDLNHIERLKLRIKIKSITNFVKYVHRCQNTKKQLANNAVTVSEFIKQTGCI